MARRDSKSWRRSRTLSTAFLFDSPAKGPAALFKLPLRTVALPTLVALAFVVCLVLLRASPSGSAAPPLASLAPNKAAAAAEHPDFDFDAHLEQHEALHRVLGEDDDDAAAGEGADDDEPVTADDGGDDGDSDDAEDETDERDGGLPSRRPGTSLAQPFLPFTCDGCSSASPLHPSPPICSKYRSSAPTPASSTVPSDARSSALHPDILDHSVLFAGTGAEVRRVLKRAMRSSLYAAKRAREGAEEDAHKAEDEEPFRILVLGGSVSNCRGVDPNTACWHAHVLRWFQQTLPMEGDRDLVPVQPSLLVPAAAPRPLPIVEGRERAKRAKRSSMPGAPADDAAAVSAPPVLAKRAVPATHKQQQKKKKKKKPKAKTVKSGSGKSRRRPSTKLINGSKSATGSAFFAYCFDEEMTLRRKNVDWGLGPDLVILETGVNDVWPGGERATRDFEKLLRTLRSLPSKPAVIALEAASLLLASTTSMSSNAEYDHLPAAHFYDVPVLSAKQALFGSVAGLSPFDPTADPSSSPNSPVSKIDDLFLPDLHHPNERGHELLADVLISFLEQQACIAQSELLTVADARIRASSSRLSTSAASEDAAHRVDPSLDFSPRKAEAVRPLPARSLFTPFAFDKKGRKKEEWWELPPPRCIQVGNAKTSTEPVKNRGWSKLAWARDKQYLVSDEPGASVTFRVEVGQGGTVMADWLHSRFYDLGDVAVYLDGDRSKAAKLAGYWDLGWSIGVPTEVFTGVAAGPHEVTFEVLAASESSHPSRKTNFRLIGLITT